MANNQDIVLLRFVAAQERREAVVFCIGRDTHCLMGQCVLSRSSKNYDGPCYLEPYTKFVKNYPGYVCCGCGIRLRDHAKWVEYEE